MVRLDQTNHILLPDQTVIVEYDCGNCPTELVTWHPVMPNGVGGLDLKAEAGGLDLKAKVGGLDLRPNCPVDPRMCPTKLWHWIRIG